MRRRLTAAHTLDTASILNHSHLHLSPSVGLIAASRAVLSNTYSIGGNTKLPPPWAAAAALTLDLFAPPRTGASLRPTRSRSAAFSHLNSADAGHVLGLGLSRAPADHITSTLKRCGIETNRVRGEWTGVSLARYKKLVELLATSSSSSTPSIPLFLRCVWERAESKKCLLDFLVALDDHVGCLTPHWRNMLTTDTAAADAWCESHFDPIDTDETAVAAAAMRVLRPFDCSGDANEKMSYARSLEILAANLSEVHAFKPPNILERHSYQGGESKPDCVEMLLRELFDLLLYNPATQTFEVERLPTSALPELLRHYEQRNSGELLPEDAGAAWFPLCQDHTGTCKYISSAPSGGAYELHPTLSNLSAAAGVLLGRSDDNLDSLRSVQAYWNGVHLQERSGSEAQPIKLIVDESGSGPYRPQLSDTSRMRELVRLKLEGGRFGVEFLLEVDPPIAIATHRREDTPWAEGTTRAHLDAWRKRSKSAEVAEMEEEEEEEEARRRVLDVLWPVVLGERMLDSLDERTANTDAIIQSVLAAAWDGRSKDGTRVWNPAVETSTVEDAHATMREASRKRSQARYLKALNMVAACKDEKVVEAMVPWLLRRLPDEIENTLVAEALLPAPWSVITTDVPDPDEWHFPRVPRLAVVGELHSFAHEPLSLGYAVRAFRRGLVGLALRARMLKSINGAHDDARRKRENASRKIAATFTVTADNTTAILRRRTPTALYAGLRTFAIRIFLPSLDHTSGEAADKPATTATTSAIAAVCHL